MLLDKGANINKKERGGRTALTRAIENGSQEIVKMLLDKKANINRVYRLPEFEDLWVRHGTILWKRFEAYITGVRKDEAEGDWRRGVALQTMQLGTRIMAPTMQRWDRRHQQREAGGVEEDEESALFTRGLEKLEGRAEVFQETHGLLRLIGAPIAALFYQYYRTPLSRAAERGDLALVTQLLDWPGTQPKQSTFIRTPLSLAAENGHGSVVKLLVERNADINFKFIGGRTPLSYAAENGHRDVVEVLLRSDTLDVDSKETDTLRIPQATDNGEPDLIVTLAESKLMTAGPPCPMLQRRGSRRWWKYY
ncbi:Ankyrin repeat-containing domain-containing protein [Aspergillus oryzae]|uniref:Ankyrin repeat-containing domain-containing protein n=1 Tax=Aspergillus oryzae TaxID=5062 RepID=A0A1S9DRX3_ASPOZ|nr:Ankyrin repeat-containing domain-containing protein [Aspergillus oryzae]